MNLYVTLLFIQTLLVHLLDALTYTTILGLSLIFANTQLYKDHTCLYLKGYCYKRIYLF